MYIHKYTARHPGSPCHHHGVTESTERHRPKGFKGGIYMLAKSLPLLFVGSLANTFTLTFVYIAYLPAPPPIYRQPILPLLLLGLPFFLCPFSSFWFCVYNGSLCPRPQENPGPHVLDLTRTECPFRAYVR